jgi:hypothetical protein
VLTRDQLAALAPALEPPVTICVLLYGDHAPLCERFFSQLAANTPPDAFHLRIGLNAVGDRTTALVADVTRRFPCTRVYESAENLYKGPMSRRMFHDDPIRTKWTIWFDDDSYVFRADWLLCLALAIQARPEVDMWGQHFLIWAGDPLLEFIRGRPWYRGLPFQSVDGKTKIDFIAGGFWPVLSRWLYSLDWPDPKILHYSDDYLFGEALRQNGGKIAWHTSGVVVNAALRRSPPDTPKTY